jgi:hypothetical protein
METRERSRHFIRLDGINSELASMGIEFGITLMEDDANLRSYSVRAWWRDDEQKDYSSLYAGDDQIFELSKMADAIDWLYEAVSKHLVDKLEHISSEGKRAERLLKEITCNEYFVNAFRL